MNVLLKRKWMLAMGCVLSPIVSAQSLQQLQLQFNGQPLQENTLPDPIMMVFEPVVPIDGTLSGLKAVSVTLQDKDDHSFALSVPVYLQQNSTLMGLNALSAASMKVSDQPEWVSGQLVSPLLTVLNPNLAVQDLQEGLHALNIQLTQTDSASVALLQNYKAVSGVSGFQSLSLSQLQVSLAQESDALLTEGELQVADFALALSGDARPFAWSATALTSNGSYSYMSQSGYYDFDLMRSSDPVISQISYQNLSGDSAVIELLAVSDADIVAVANTPSAQLSPGDRLYHFDVTDSDSLFAELGLRANYQDNDGDGHVNQLDAFPDDGAEWADTDRDGVGNNADQDDDDDGVEDAVELAWDMDPLNKNDQWQDDDGDGFSNAEELLQGSSPYNPHSTPETVATMPVAGDLDHNRVSDLLWRHQQNGDNYVYLMDSDGHFTAKRINRAPIDWQLVATGQFVHADVNETAVDAKMDLLWRNQVTGAVYLYAMDGAAVAKGYPISKIVDQDWTVAGAGDFNGDGRDDLYWRHQVSGLNYLYQMQPNGTYKGRSLGTVPTEWDLIAVADVNGDQTDDIVWRNTQSGAIWVHLYQDNKVHRVQFISVIEDPDWSLAAVVDLDQDGDEDLLWRHRSLHLTYLYQMQDGKLLRGSALNKTSADWTLASHGDFNQDGLPDLVWRHQQSGENVIEYMHRFKHARFRKVNVVGMDWRLIAP